MEAKTKLQKVLQRKTVQYLVYDILYITDLGLAKLLMGLLYSSLARGKAIVMHGEQPVGDSDYTLSFYL